PGRRRGRRRIRHAARQQHRQQEDQDPHGRMEHGRLLHRTPPDAVARRRPPLGMPAHGTPGPRRATTRRDGRARALAFGLESGMLSGDARRPRGAVTPRSARNLLRNATSSPPAARRAPAMPAAGLDGRPRDQGSEEPMRSSRGLIPGLVAVLIVVLSLSTGCKPAPKATATALPPVKVTPVIERDVPVYREWIGTTV